MPVATDHHRIVVADVQNKAGYATTVELFNLTEEIRLGEALRYTYVRVAIEALLVKE